MQASDIVALDVSHQQVAERRFDMESDIAPIFVGTARLLFGFGVLAHVPVAEIGASRRCPYFVAFSQGVAPAVDVAL